MSICEINAPQADAAAASGASSLLVRRERLILAILLLVFFFGLLGTLKQLERYHGDERYYTDAAIMMLHSADWLSPTYADGGGRFNKPLLTYWILCASYKAFGISLFSSRLPFLIAGCGVLWLTWRLGRILFADAESALLAAVFMAANVQTMTIATRSTPDIFLCLFVTASLCGFAQVFVGKKRSELAYAFAYLGAGLACATKGLLGIAPVLFALAIWRMFYRKELSRCAVLPWLWLIVGALVGLSSFLLIILKHGSGSLLMFFKDQTAIDAKPDKWFLFGNFADYLGALVRHFLPWTLLVTLAGFAAWPAAKEFARGHRAQLRIALGWTAVVFGIFVFAFVRRTRYLIPAYPCIAVVLGAAFVFLLRQPRAQPILRRIVATLAIIACLAVLAPAIVAGRFDTPFTGSLGLALAACGVIGYLRKDLAAGISVFGLWIILAFCSLVIFWWPLFEINPAEKLTRELLLRSAGRSIASLQIPPATSSQIRLLSGGQLNPQSFASTKDLPADSVVIFTEQSRETFATGTYEIVPAGYLAKASKPKEMWRALRSGEVRGKAQNYYVAVPFSAKAQ